MRRRPRFLPVASALVLASFPSIGFAAAPGATAPASGGLEAVEVSVDASAGVVRTKRGARAGRELAIPIERGRLDVAASTIEVIPIGEGRSVVHVRVPDAQRKDLAFEALVGGDSDEPIWSGLTGYTRGSEGDRAGDLVLVFDRDGASKFVIVGEAREDTRICGQDRTPLGARGLDPRSMQLRGATLHRLSKDARAGAARVIATARPEGARTGLAKVLTAVGGSAPGAAALTDGKIDTTWSEQRPGDGHGEFVTMTAAQELELTSLVVTIAPPSPSPDGAAPRTFFVATDDRLLHVTMPEDGWRKPTQSYEIPLPKLRTSCVAVVLDEAYVGARGAPAVSIAEVEARTRFDAEAATLNDVAEALGGARAEEAAALLRRAGDGGLASVLARYASLDGKGRALAVDVASSAGTCGGAAGELLTRALTDREVEVRKRALGRVERCGKTASEALVAAVRSDDEPRRAAAAPLLATVAPGAALEPLAEQLGRGAPETRRAVRAAFARAASSAPRDKLLALLGPRELPPASRLDLLRGLGPRLGDLRPEAPQVVAELLKASPDMSMRYLLAQPLAHLARAQDATAGELSRMADLARRDPEWAVRARAVELATGIAPLAPTVLAAASDPEPRVREAALRAIATSATAAGTSVAARALASDEWTFVRVAAAEALGALPVTPQATDALASALEDRSAKVRAAAVGALGKQRAPETAARVRERLDDAREDPDVRALAARTLAALCDRSATDRLTTLALRSRSPVDQADDRIGLAAIEALGALHPADLDRRLAPLRDKSVPPPVRRAAERALAEPGICR